MYRYVFIGEIIFMPHPYSDLSGTVKNFTERFMKTDVLKNTAVNVHMIDVGQNETCVITQKLT